MNRPLIAGERFGFRERAPAAHPEPWRELDRAVWRWMRAHGAEETVARAAAWASHADGEGHSALPLEKLAADPSLSDAARVRAALQASPFVACGGEASDTSPRPLALDGEHLYLWRNHRAECAVADALRRRRQGAREAALPLSDADLRALFNGSWSEPEARQRDAVRQAPGRRLMVLTGGPGTGKTTTVLRMLLGLSREYEARTGRLPQLHVAAPTGKAAQRLSESLRSGADRLCAASQPLDAAWMPHLHAVLAAEAGTVHRLLGSRGRHGGYRYRADEPLPADIVVVDEASMLELGLLRALLDALREDAVLVLVGDADQLTSVGTGSVMMDLVEALEADPRGDLARLSHCFRADTTLVPIHEAVRAGDPASFRAAMSAAQAHGSFEQPPNSRHSGESRNDVSFSRFPHVAGNGRPAASWHRVADAAALRRRLHAWARELAQSIAEADLVRPVEVDCETLLAHLERLRRQQLLCALREGPFGALAASAAIAARLRASSELAPWAQANWYPGRAVLITRNDHAARLYNGDVGLCVRVKGENGDPLLRVAFDPAPDAARAGQAAPVARLFDPNTLPAHEDAFALTVHKSQGSEYDHVAVLLPPDADSPLLARQTLYTGLSRARHSLELWSCDASAEKAIATVLERFGRLAERVVDGSACGCPVGSSQGKA